MKRRIKITGKRQITIPAEIFDALGLNVGEHLFLEEDQGELRLSPELSSDESTVLDTLRGSAESDGEPGGKQHDQIIADEAGGNG